MFIFSHPFYAEEKEGKKDEKEEVEIEKEAKVAF